MSEKKQPFDDLTRVVFELISAEGLERDRIRESRDDWKNRYFKQADRIDAIQNSINKIQSYCDNLNTGISFIAAICLVILFVELVCFFVGK